MILAALAPILFCTGMVFASDPTLVVIDNKLVKVESVVQPKLTVSLPSGQVDMGEIVILEAKVDGEVPTYVKSRTYKWNVTERGFVKQFWADGPKVIFGSGTRQASIKVSCQVDLTYVIGKEEIIKRVVQDVNIEVGPLLPVPNPDPLPNPPNPPALDGIAKMSYDWAMKDGPLDKAKSAQVLAKTLNEIAAQIGHDASLGTPRSILIETKRRLNEGLVTSGFDPKTWDPWGVDLQTYAYEQYQAKKMVNIEDYKTAWVQIAKGLSAVK